MNEETRVISDYPLNGLAKLWVLSSQPWQVFFTEQFFNEIGGPAIMASTGFPYRVWLGSQPSLVYVQAPLQEAWYRHLGLGHHRLKCEPPPLRAVLCKIYNHAQPCWLCG